MKISKLLELLLDRDIDVLTVKHSDYYAINCNDSNGDVIIAVTGATIKQTYRKLANKLTKQQIKELNKPNPQKAARCY